MSLDPAVYPHFELYPPVMQPLPVVQKVVSTCYYPCFDICKQSYVICDVKANDSIDPAVYPNFNLYPSVLQTESTAAGSPCLSNATMYPVFDLCEDGLAMNPTSTEHSHRSRDVPTI